MIIILNTGMPGRQTTQLTNASQNNEYCHLCFESDKFKRLTLNKYLGEKNFTQVSSCFSNNTIENVLINCSSEYSNSIRPNYSNFEMKQIICNLF